MGSATQRRRHRRLVASVLAATAVALVLLAGGCTADAAAAPRLQMAQPTQVLPPLQSAAGGGGADSNGTTIGVQLLDPALNQTVWVNLTLLLPAAGGGGAGGSSAAAWVPAAEAAAAAATASGLAARGGVWLEPAALKWDALEAGSVKYVQLRSATAGGLPAALTALGGGGGTSSQQQLLLVQLAAASGAGIVPSRSSTTLVLGGTAGSGSGNSSSSDGGNSTGAPMFGFEPNQVAYPPGGAGGGGNATASIPVHLLGGQLSQPATLRYRLVPSASAAAPVRQLFASSKALHGLLTFNPAAAVGSKRHKQHQQQQPPQYIRVPLQWDAIPLDAEYRLALELEAVYNSRVLSQPQQVALFIFGTPNGTCPPGTARSPSSGGSFVGGNSSSGGSSSATSTSSGGSGFLSVNGSVLHLSSNHNVSGHQYGAMVDSNVSFVTLCLQSSDLGAATVRIPSVDNGSSAEGGLLLPPNPKSRSACGCDVASNTAEFSTQSLTMSQAGSSSSGGRGRGSCAYAAWQLPLPLTGQNEFNVTLPQLLPPGAAPAPAPESAAAPPAAAGMAPRIAGFPGAAVQQQQQQQQQYSLAVVRLADPRNSQLESISVQLDGGNATAILCGPTSTLNLTASRQPAGSTAAAAVHLSGITPTCRPGVLLSLNVSTSVRTLSLMPQLLVPGVPGIRVEVNGQVLSRDDDASANQAEDTTAQQQQQQQQQQDLQNSSTALLPSVFILGMQLGGTIDAEVIVVAEDGVSTSRYPIHLLLVQSSAELSVAAAAGANASAAASVAAAAHADGWPLKPAANPACTVCPAGWAASGVNSTACQMCSPGSFAPEAQSPACRPCQPGTFAYSWGSSYCKNCIVGTYAASANASLCEMCPTNTTTKTDGQSSCDIPFDPASFQTPQYALVVSFGVVLTGVEPQDVIVRAGVYADPTTIVTNLLRSDTASAFNISQQDVSVASLEWGSRRSLRANVTAMLGVDVPPGATEEDIAAALEVERISADDPIALLSSDPDRFFGRTTKTLDVQAQGTVQATLESRPGSRTAPALLWGMLGPGILAILGGSALLITGCRKSRACAKWQSDAVRRLATTRLAPRSLQYSRYTAAA